MSYRLSRNFFITNYTETIPDSEIEIKSFFALLLGIIPFGFTKLWLLIFNLSAHYDLSILGISSASLMMLSAKLFSYSQWLIWGKYVPLPGGDSPNSRLAQYGFNDQPWIDLITIYNAFYHSDELSDTEWNLDQWKEVII
jgi:hypothetical protein